MFFKKKKKRVLTSKHYIPEEMILFTLNLYDAYLKSNTYSDRFIFWNHLKYIFPEMDIKNSNNCSFNCDDVLQPYIWFWVEE